MADLSFKSVGDKPLLGDLKLYVGAILITTLSLFHFFKNNQILRKAKFFSFKNFFRKCECIKTCCLPRASNLLKNTLEKL